MRIIFDVCIYIFRLATALVSRNVCFVVNVGPRVANTRSDRSLNFFLQSFSISYAEGPIPLAKVVGRMPHKAQRSESRRLAEIIELHVKWSKMPWSSKHFNTELEVGVELWWHERISIELFSIIYLLENGSKGQNVASMHTYMRATYACVSN